MIDRGVDPKRLIPGTGLTNLIDTARLTRHAVDRGCAGAMVLPPFYIKDVTDDGLFAYYARLIERVGSDDLRIYLYHIPPVAHVGLSIELVQRLHSAFPAQIVGIKDSSGDWANTRRLLTEVPGLIVYPGSELPLFEALALGAAGCITATANINATQIAKAIELQRSGREAEAKQQHESVKKFRLEDSRVRTDPRAEVSALRVEERAAVAERPSAAGRDERSPRDSGCAPHSRRSASPRRRSPRSNGPAGSRPRRGEAAAADVCRCAPLFHVPIRGPASVNSIRSAPQMMSPGVDRHHLAQDPLAHARMVDLLEHVSQHEGLHARLLRHVQPCRDDCRTPRDRRPSVPCRSCSGSCGSGRRIPAASLTTLGHTPPLSPE